jgi:hypothetical protein
MAVISDATSAAIEVTGRSVGSEIDGRLWSVLEAVWQRVCVPTFSQNDPALQQVAPQGTARPVHPSTALATVTRAAPMTTRVASFICVGVSREI